MFKPQSLLGRLHRLNLVDTMALGELICFKCQAFLIYVTMSGQDINERPTQIYRSASLN